MKSNKRPPKPQSYPSRPESSRGNQPIQDVREQFARKTTQTEEELQTSRAFVEGKIEMVRSDPRLTEAEKTAAITVLQQQHTTENKDRRAKRSKK
jgi:hypothetical protein